VPVRVLAPIAILLLIALLVTALLSALLVRSDRLREELELRASATLGASVRSGTLSLSWPPPRIRVHRPELISAEGGSSPLQAEFMDLRLQLAPLLRGRIAPRSIEIHAAVLRLVRDSGGIRLAGSRPTAADNAPRAKEPAERSPPALAFEDLRVHGGRVVLRDSSSGPEVLLQVEDIEARLGPFSGEALALQARGALSRGGRFTAAGELSNGRLKLTADLDSLDLSQLAELLGGASELSARASGRVVVEAEEAVQSGRWRLDHLIAELQLADAVLRIKQVEMLGTVALHAELATDLARPGCRFRLDATRAELRYGEAYHKPSGTGAHVTGELTLAADGSLHVDNLRLKVGRASAGE